MRNDQSRDKVLLCWTHAVIAAFATILVFTTSFSRPSLQLEYSRATGRVVTVDRGGAADRAGILVGDRLLTIQGVPATRGSNPLYFVRAGQPVPLLVERAGRRPFVAEVQSVSFEEARQEALVSGGGDAVSALNSYLRHPLNVWMLMLGVTLLIVRPDHRDAMIAALAFICWSGGNFLAKMPGMGAVFSSLSPAGRISIYLIDSYLIAMFFALCLDFALVFPFEASERVRARWRVLAYVAPLPIFVETAWTALRRAVSTGSPPLARLDGIYPILGPLLLFVSLAILATRFMRMSDLHARRRLRLVFLALLPGALGFGLSALLERMDASYAWRQFGETFNIAGTLAGSAIFTYAVVRHRMFNIRVLVRRSLQYALARGTLLAAMTLPLVVLGGFLYVHRNESLITLLAAAPAIYVLLAIPLLLVIRYRRRLLEALDRRFFREEYDAKHLLLQVVSMIRGGSDMLGVSHVAFDEIDRALHPHHLSLWQLDERGESYQRSVYRGDPPRHVDPLPAGGALSALLVNDEEPLDLHSRPLRPLVKRLSLVERNWLEGVDAHLIVPLVVEQRLAAFIVLGERKSEEPYSRDDREVLRSLAAQLAFTLDYSRLKASPNLIWAHTTATTGSIDSVRSCAICWRCFPADRSVCDLDNAALITEEGIPHVLEDKYVLTRVLGRGGMGSVFLATQKRLNRPVAIKVLHPHLVPNAAMRSRFEREARIVARLRHPSIVTIHDFGVLPSAHAYLVMEYINGETLRLMILGGPVDYRRALSIVRPVGDAVEMAHRAGVVHRDLKPENVMLVRDADNAQSTPRVLDFGLARINEPMSGDNTSHGSSSHGIGFVGTLLYVAPEMLSGAAADARSDQYSLAVMTYELLSGSHPLAGAMDLAAVVRGHTEGELPSLATRVPFMPEAVSAAVHRALSKDPNERFPTVGAFMQALG